MPRARAVRLENRLDIVKNLILAESACSIMTIVPLDSQ